MSQTTMKLGVPMRVELPEPPRVKSVKALDKVAKANGQKLMWIGRKLDAKWIAWHRGLCA